MGKLIFKYNKDEEDFIREAVEISLTTPDNMTIYEFKVICVRMAAAMGYGHKSIEDGFGDLVFGETDKHNITNLINDIRGNTNTK